MVALILPKLFATPLAWIQLCHIVMNCIDVPGNICGSWEWFVTDLAFVLRILVFGFWMDGQARLRIIAFATIAALEWGLFCCSCGAALSIPMNPLHVTLQTWFLWKSSLAKGADQQRGLVWLLHMRFNCRLCGENLKKKFSFVKQWKLDNFYSMKISKICKIKYKTVVKKIQTFYLVAKLTREAFAHVVMEALNVGQEVVLLQEQLVADKALEGLAVVRGGKM